MLKIFGKLPSGDRKQKILSSKNYDGKQFNNLEITPTIPEDTNVFKIAREFFFGGSKNATPKADLPLVKTNIENIKEEDYYIWFGHSSYLLKIAGKTYLLDPVFSGNVSPIPNSSRAFLGTNYYQSEHMPKIDYLIITHDHYDHLDYKTVVELKQKVNKVIVPLGVGEHFEYWGYDKNKIIEVDWEDSVSLEENAKITAVPTRHMSGRFLKVSQSLWTSYVLEIDNRKIFLGGDSCYGKHFKEIGEKHGNFDVAFLENGQYNVHWKYSHMFPEETLMAAKDLNVKTLIPIHNSKFKLATHAWNEQLKELTRINKEKYNLNILTPKIGEVVDLNNEKTYENWFE